MHSSRQVNLIEIFTILHVGCKKKTTDIKTFSLWIKIFHLKLFAECITVSFSYKEKIFSYKDFDFKVKVKWWNYVNLYK